MIYFPAALIIIVNVLLYVSRIPYTCQPYMPTEDCETGRYEIAIYEHDYDRSPIATVESHCVILHSHFIYGDRFRAEIGRYIAYSTSKEETEEYGPIRDVQYFEVQDFMKDNAEVCKFL